MAKTSKTPKAPKSFKSYALNKCLIGYGVVNGIINAAIFAGINAGAPDAMFGMHDIVHDLAFTGLLLGMLLFACVVPLTRMDLRKGVFSLPGAAGGAFPLVSSSYAVSILGVGALAAVVMTGAGALLSKSILSSEVIAYDDLGTEAVRKLSVKDFPVVVVMDSQGNNLYETAIKQYCKE